MPSESKICKASCSFTLLYTMSFELPTQNLKECKTEISWTGLPCWEEGELPVACSLSLKQSFLSIRGREGRFWWTLVGREGERRGRWVPEIGMAALCLKWRTPPRRGPWVDFIHLIDFKCLRTQYKLVSHYQTGPLTASVSAEAHEYVNTICILETCLTRE